MPQPIPTIKKISLRQAAGFNAQPIWIRFPGVNYIWSVALADPLNSQSYLKMLAFRPSTLNFNIDI